MKKQLLFVVLFISNMYSQSNDQKMLSDIYKFSLTRSSCYSWLDDLSNKIGARLSGSKGAENAVIYTKQKLESLGLDSVFLQEVMVPKWVRGEKETAYILDNNSKTIVPICALGGSVATAKLGLTAEVVEVKSLKELESLGASQLKGKIIFYNRPFDP